ncbi:hypothetical protein D3C84_609110 [compost metagenome]
MLLIGLRPATASDVPGQPLSQIVGVVRVDAHARRVAVERMAQLDRAVGLAPSKFCPGFDHQQRAFTGQAQQLRRQHRAAEATADDQDVRVADGVGRLSALGFSHGVLTAQCLPR